MKQIAKLTCITMNKKKNKNWDGRTIARNYKNLNSSAILKIKFCPVISVGVEWTCLTFNNKNILNDRGHNLTTEHVKEYLIVYVYKVLNNFNVM